MTPAVPVSVHLLSSRVHFHVCSPDAEGYEAQSRAKMTTKVSFIEVDNEWCQSQKLVQLMGSDAMTTARHWTSVRQGTAGRPIVDGKGEAIAELMLEVAQFFFRIRAVGQKTGLITSWGGGAFGFMRSLALLGPLTVPQIAQMRPTSRQRMQRLADELAAEGLVDFIDNPKHRRSKLVRLTAKGDARYRAMNLRLMAIASTLGADLSEGELRTTREVVRRLSDEMKGRTE